MDGQRRASTPGRLVAGIAVASALALGVLAGTATAAGTLGTPAPQPRQTLLPSSPDTPPPPTPPATRTPSRPSGSSSSGSSSSGSSSSGSSSSGSSSSGSSSSSSGTQTTTTPSGPTPQQLAAQAAAQAAAKRRAERAAAAARRAAAARLRLDHKIASISVNVGIEASAGADATRGTIRQLQADAVAQQGLSTAGGSHGDVGGIVFFSLFAVALIAGIALTANRMHKGRSILRSGGGSITLGQKEIGLIAIALLSVAVMLFAWIVMV